MGIKIVGFTGSLRLDGKLTDDYTRKAIAKLLETVVQKARV